MEASYIRTSMFEVTGDIRVTLVTFDIAYAICWAYKIEARDVSTNIVWRGSYYIAWSIEHDWMRITNELRDQPTAHSTIQHKQAWPILQVKMRSTGKMYIVPAWCAGSVCLQVIDRMWNNLIWRTLLTSARWRRNCNAPHIPLLVGSVICYLFFVCLFVVVCGLLFVCWYWKTTALIIFQILSFWGLVLKVDEGRHLNRFTQFSIVCGSMFIVCYFNIVPLTNVQIFLLLGFVLKLMWGNVSTKKFYVHAMFLIFEISVSEAQLAGFVVHCLVLEKHTPHRLSKLDVFGPCVESL